MERNHGLFPITRQSARAVPNERMTVREYKRMTLCFALKPLSPPTRRVHASLLTRPLKILEAILPPVAGGRQPGLAAACQSSCSRVEERHDRILSDAGTIYHRYLSPLWGLPPGSSLLRTRPRSSAWPTYSE